MSSRGLATIMSDYFARPQFPATRMRRLRSSSAIRTLVQETHLTCTDLIWPLFVLDGTERQEPIESMPGVTRYSIDKIVEQARYAETVGIQVLALFPRTPDSLKDAEGREALNPDNLICRAVKAVKAECPNILLLCDVALDPYTDHGHDGLLSGTKIQNDETVNVLVEQARTLAEAGCDIIAPSDMMDGRIGAIRKMLEEEGYSEMMIMSYAAKFASGFYNPFRDAVGAGRQLGTEGKKTYQMNPANRKEAIREVLMDIDEGADMVMVKPGMPYLDIVRDICTATSVPCFAYQISGEYAMLRAAEQNGWLDGDVVIEESLLAFKRAGATGILTYFAPFIAEKLLARSNST